MKPVSPVLPDRTSFPAGVYFGVSKMKEKKAERVTTSEVAEGAPIGWEKITIEISPQMKDALKTLVSTGLFGFSIEDAAERIIAADLHSRTRR